MTSYATFDDWFYEVEGFGLRAERATDGLGPNAKRWLETAWQLGAEAERKACADIADLATSCEDMFEDDKTTAESIRDAILARSTPKASEPDALGVTPIRGAFAEAAKADLGSVFDLVRDENGGDRDEVQRDRMEAAGCLAISALKACNANGALSGAQRALIEEALTAMFDAKERWHSNPAAARKANES